MRRPDCGYLWRNQGTKMTWTTMPSKPPTSKHSLLMKQLPRRFYFEPSCRHLCWSAKKRQKLEIEENWQKGRLQWNWSQWPNAQLVESISPYLHSEVLFTLPKNAEKSKVKNQFIYLVSEFLSVGRITTRSKLKGSATACKYCSRKSTTRLKTTLK